MRWGALVRVLGLLATITLVVGGFEEDEDLPMLSYLWPVPNGAVEKGNRTARVYPDRFIISLQGRHRVLERAIQRYASLMFPFPFDSAVDAEVRLLARR